MKVFVSSTCFDLLDLRAELYEDLRDLGVDPIFSDLKESEFAVSASPNTNSIDTCLANVLESDVVLVLLSQRYGPNLGPTFGALSATHLEYRHARNAQKRIHFYVRDRLDADFVNWRRNGKKADFKGAWCGDEGEKGLFAILEEHRALVGENGTAAANNWYSTFRGSPDLRSDVRRRLAPQAYKDTGAKLIASGQAPLLLVQSHGLSAQVDNNIPVFYRFTFELVNVGQMPAMKVKARLQFPDNSQQIVNAKMGAVLPGLDPTTKLARTIQIDVDFAIINKQLHTPKAVRGHMSCDLLLNYSTPTGHLMQDIILVTFNAANQLDPRPGPLPEFLRKTITGVQPILFDSGVALS